MSSKRTDKKGFFGNPFGGLFDLDGDGREDLAEQYMAYCLFEEMLRQQNDSEITDEENER